MNRVAAQVRAVEQGDLPEVLRLLAQLHEEPEPIPSSPRLLAAFEAILRDSNRTLLVARQGGSLVGTVDVTVVFNLGRGGRPWGMLENFVVASPVRGQGIGSALLEAAVEICRAAGVYKIQLVSHNRHSDAAGFYEASGFDAPVRGFRRYFD